MAEFSVELASWLVPAGQRLVHDTSDQRLEEEVQVFFAIDAVGVEAEEREKALVAALRKDVNAQLSNVKGRFAKLFPAAMGLPQSFQPQTVGAPIAHGAEIRFGDTDYYSGRRSTGVNADFQGGLALYLFSDGYLYMSAAYRGYTRVWLSS
jgi:hypothetical protein